MEVRFLEYSLSTGSHPAFIGHNDHTNEPSHHIPYLYALAGAPSKGQARIRSIAAVDYNATAKGLAGVRLRPLQAIPHSRPFSERRLWPDERLVVVFGAWLLPCQSVQYLIRCRLPLLR
jgi:Glycosyl hydrolase family 92 catalytic domain